MVADAPSFRMTGLLLRRPDVLVASALLNMAAFAVPLFTLQLYDRIIPNASYGTMSAMLFGVAAAILLEMVLRHARATIVGWNSAQEEHALSRIALARILAADPQRTPPTSVLADSMSAIAEWRAQRNGPVSFAVADLPFALIFLGYLAWLSPLLAITACLAGLPGLLGALALSRQAAQAIADRTRSETSRNGLTHEALTAIEALKAMAAEALMTRRHERLVATSAAAGRRTQITTQLCQALAGAGSQSVIVCVALVGSWLIMHEKLSGGAVAAAIMFATRGIEPLSRLASATPVLVRMLAVRARIQQLLALPQLPRGTATPPPPASLTLDEVTIALPNGNLLLDRVALRLNAGECIALHGGGGSGKSRLLLTIAGLVPPTSGQVLLDDLPREQCDAAWLRHQVALLPQRPALIPGRVIDNLSGFDATLVPAALELAKEVGLDAYFDRQPAGYATVVGRATGQELPPSVIERIAVVRALAPRPRVILFDDANGAQDRDGDRRLRSLLARLRPEAAILLVTDRADWLSLADRQYRIEDRRIVRIETA